MISYEIPNVNRTQTYSDIRMPPSGPDNVYSFKPGEFPIKQGRLPNLLNREYFGRGQLYCSATMVQEEAREKGYKIPERENLPYLGHAEDLTNKSNFN